MSSSADSCPLFLTSTKVCCIIREKCKIKCYIPIEKCKYIIYIRIEKCKTVGKEVQDFNKAMPKVSFGVLL